MQDLKSYCLARFFSRTSITSLTSGELCHMMLVDQDFSQCCEPLALEICWKVSLISWLKLCSRYLWLLVLNRRKKPYAWIDFPDFWRASCLLICCRLCCKHFFNYFQSWFPQAHLAVPSDYHRNRANPSCTVTLLPALFSIIIQPVFTGCHS